MENLQKHSFFKMYDSEKDDIKVDVVSVKIASKWRSLGLGELGMWQLLGMLYLFELMCIRRDGKRYFDMEYHRNMMGIKNDRWNENLKKELFCLSEKKELGKIDYGQLKLSKEELLYIIDYNEFEFSVADSILLDHLIDFVVENELDFFAFVEIMQRGREYEGEKIIGMDFNRSFVDMILMSEMELDREEYKELLEIGGI